jgi:hypothetical protein
MTFSPRMIVMNANKNDNYRNFEESRQLDARGPLCHRGREYGHQTLDLDCFSG